MKRGSLSAAMLLVATGALAGCDAWPTQAVNHTKSQIEFRWRHKNHAEWSFSFSLAPGEETFLARAHYVEDFTGIQIAEGHTVYTFVGRDMDRIKSFCLRLLLDHIDTLGDCEISYLGGGRVAVKRLQ